MCKVLMKNYQPDREHYLALNDEDTSTSVEVTPEVNGKGCGEAIKQELDTAISTQLDQVRRFFDVMLYMLLSRIWNGASYLVPLPPYRPPLTSYHLPHISPTLRLCM